MANECVFVWQQERRAFHICPYSTLTWHLPSIAAQLPWRVCTCSSFCPKPPLLLPTSLCLPGAAVPIPPSRRFVAGAVPVGFLFPLVAAARRHLLLPLDSREKGAAAAVERQGVGQKARPTEMMVAEAAAAAAARAARLVVVGDRKSVV